ncbi:MAG: thiamine pyrophosphate-binding protein [Mycobacterium sp.]|uniref:thiamine pyrophosphate-binding protein n=1 Tax=Mycobacterium sp. TaxID=1785 RepID=UPI003CC61E3D
MYEPIADAELSVQCRVVDHVVAYLAETGVEYIFAVDGANIEDLYDAAHFCEGITPVLAKHEFSAAAMADGYSRSGAGLGVVAATSGGGALNLVPGLGEALASRVPVLALVGQPPITLDGQGSFQDTSGCNGSLNAEALFSAVSVYCRRVKRPAEIVDALPAAIDAANRGGPAVLLLPKDVQQAHIAVGRPNVNRHRNGRPLPDGSRVDLEPVVRMLGGAGGPVAIIAGEQVARDDARTELEHLGEVLQAWVATAPDAKDVGSPGLGASSPLGVTGVMGHPRVAAAIGGSALCLLVGTRLPLTARTGLADALARVPIISMGSAPPYVACTHIHTEDLRTSLSRLAQLLTEQSNSPSRVLVPDKTGHARLTSPSHAGARIRYSDAMAVLDAVLPDGADIVVDAGNTGAAAIHHLPVRHAGRFVVALGMGGMGYSFGAGIGMAFARRRRTVVIAGDGAFYMHGMEVHTAVQYRLPVTFVLFNNNAHAMCAIREQLFYGDLYSYNRFRPSRLAAGLAAMFPDLRSAEVSDINELSTALDAALNLKGPSVVSVECSADEIPPFTPFLVWAAPKVSGTQGLLP